jgi:hypothetical protein
MRSIGSSCSTQLTTTRFILLREDLAGVGISLNPTASDGGECIVAMLFWVVAVLSVVGVLAVVWAMYLLFRRWL